MNSQKTEIDSSGTIMLNAGGYFYLNQANAVLSSSGSIHLNSSGGIIQINSNNSSGNINNIVYYTNNNCKTFTISSNLYNAGVSNSMSGTTYNINSISPITIDSYIYITANELIYYYYN
jgi:hypothetical protein